MNGSPVTPPSGASPAAAPPSDADAALQQAWTRHTLDRRNTLLLDAAVGYIDEATLEQRLDWLARPLSLPFGRALQRDAVAQGASIAREDAATALSLLLQDCAAPGQVPQGADRALLVRWGGPDSALELADDALVVADLQAPVDAGLQHRFWVLWRGETGMPTGYRLDLLRQQPEPLFETWDEQEATVTLGVEQVSPPL